MTKDIKISYLLFLCKIFKVRYATINHYNSNVVYTSYIRNFRIRRYYAASRCHVDYCQLSKIAYVGTFCKQKHCTHPFRQCKDCSFNIQF